jgi:Na+/melibiose symporter-like transporter
VSNRLSSWTLIAFGSPSIAATLLIAPVFGILPSYYAIHTKVTLAEIGTAFLLARILDALIDPVVGVLSDRTSSRLGPRLPWMIGGAILTMPALYFLFLPPADADVMYFFVWSFTVMFGWTLLTIPHGAWAAELTDDYDERSRVFGVRNVLASVGGFAFFLLPPALEPLTGSTEITVETMWALVILLWIVTPLTLIWAALRAPLHSLKTSQSMLLPSSLMAVIRSISGNGPFLSFVCITTFAGVATGMATALTFLYIQDYLKLGAYFWIFGIIAPLAGIISTPMWLWLSRRFSKHSVWSVGLLLGGIAGLPTLFLEPGEQSLYPLLAITIVVYTLHGVIIALPPAILADIADYQAWKQNTNATGNYFSLLVLLSKVTTAVGASFALLLSDFLGYAPSASNATNVTALLIPLIVIPTLMYVYASATIWSFPLNRQRQSVISRRLAQRQARAERAAAAS